MFFKHVDYFWRCLVDKCKLLTIFQYVMLNSNEQIKFWLHVLIISRTRFRVNLHSQRAPCMKQVRCTKFNWLQRDSSIVPASSMEFLDIKTIIGCRSTLKCVLDMIRAYSQMYRTDKYSQNGSILWQVWLNNWVFVYELNDCDFESHCSDSVKFFPFKN